MEKYTPLILSLAVLIVVLVILLGSVVLFAVNKSEEDFPFGVSDQPDTQVNSQTTTLDSANAEKLRRLNEAVGNWDNETTGY